MVFVILQNMQCCVWQDAGKHKIGESEICRVVCRHDIRGTALETQSVFFP